MANDTGNGIDEQFGNYRLIRLLGSGGFADVYLGEHVHLGTYAAIKVLHTKLETSQAEQFLQEARTLASLNHAHIIRLFDFNVQHMVPFLIMDYASGGTLRQRYPKGSIVPLPIIVDYVKQIASALDYAHSQKFIHRDVKPENILLMQNGQVVLSDFGVASIAHSTHSQPLTELAGTIFYIAPEQLQGRPRTASDQYALGVIVYEWLSGQRPFQGSFAEVASQHLLMPPPPFIGNERLAPGISESIQHILFTALAKDAHMRFTTLQSFASALEHASKEYTLRALTPKLASGPADNDNNSTTPSLALPVQYEHAQTETLANASPHVPAPILAIPTAEVLSSEGSSQSLPIEQAKSHQKPFFSFLDLKHRTDSSQVMLVQYLQTFSASVSPVKRKPLLIGTIIGLLSVCIFGSFLAGVNARQHRDVLVKVTATPSLIHSAVTSTPTATLSRMATPTVLQRKKAIPDNSVTPTVQTVPIVIASNTPVSVQPTPTPTPRPPVAPPPPTVAPPTPTPVPAVCPPQIQVGSQGQLVKTLQSSLNLHYSSHDFPNAPNNFSPPLMVDGDFGSLTKAAVLDYQRVHNLLVDGVVGPQTWHSLGNC